MAYAELYNSKRNNSIKSEILFSFFGVNTDLCGPKEVFDEEFKKCNFNHKFKNCNSNNFKKFAKTNPQMEFLYISEVFDFLLLILNPLICSLGLISNILNFRILSLIKNKEKSKKNWNKDHTMYGLMSINAILNVFYLIIRLLHLMSRCISQNGIFCSKINKLLEIQYFNIYVVDIFGNILKILSNITLIGISLNRYMLLHEKVRLIYEKYLSKSKMAKLIFILILLGCLVSIVIGKIFIDRVNTNIYQLDDIKDYIEFPNKNTIFLDYFYGVTPGNRREFHSYKHSSTLLSFYISNYVINDIMFLVLILIIEFLILVKAKKSFGLKKKLKQKLVLGQCLTFQKAEKSFNRILSIILINSFVTIIFRALDFCFSTYITLNKMSISALNLIICHKYNKVCTMIEELNEILFALSISYFTFIYYNLNKNFRDTFNSLFSKQSDKSSY